MRTCSDWWLDSQKGNISLVLALAIGREIHNGRALRSSSSLQEHCVTGR